MENIFVSQIKDAISILGFNESKMIEVSKRKNATYFGIGMFVIPSIVNLFLASLTFPSGFGVFFSRFLLWPMFVPVFAMIGSIFCMSFLAKRLFRGVGEHIEFFRVVSYASLVLWVSMFPFILACFGVLDAFGLFNVIWILAAIWIFAVAYRMLIFYHKVAKQDAIFVIILGVMGYILFKGVVGRILVGSAYRLLY